MGTPPRALEPSRRELLAVLGLSAGGLAGGSLLACGRPAADRGGSGRPVPTPSAGDVGVPRYELAVAIEPAAGRLAARGTLAVRLADGWRDPIRFALVTAFAPAFRLSLAAPADRAGPLDLGPPDVFGTVTTWAVRPPAPFPAGTLLVFHLRFAGGGRNDPFNVFQIAPEGSYASGSALPWYPQLLDPVVYPPATGVVRYRILGGQTLLSPGVETTGRSDRRAGIRTFEMRQPGSLGFAVARYRRMQPPGAPIGLYLLKERPHAPAALPRLTRIVQLLQTWYGPCPQPEFQIAEAPSEELLGHKMGAILLVTSPLLDRAWDDTFYGHELAHAWFGGKLNGDRWFLSEGGANYAALQLIEALHGPAAARQFRLYGRPGYDEYQSGLGYLYLAAAGYDVSLSAQPQSYAQQLVGYSKGMLVLDMLRRRMGRARFDGAIRALIAAHPFVVQPWAAIERAFSRAAGEDLRWFFAQWLERTGAPHIALEWSERDGRVTGRLRQDGETYRVDVPIALRLRGGAALQRVIEMRTAEQPFAIAAAGPVDAVELDPDYTVLRSTPELRAIAEALVPATRALMERAYAPGIQAMTQALRAPAAADPWGLTFLRRYALGRLHEAAEAWRDAVAAYRAAWEGTAVREDVASWSLIRMARAAMKAGDPAAARWAVERAADVAGRTPPSILGEEAALLRGRLVRG